MTGSDEIPSSTPREYPCIIKATNGKKVRRNNPEGQGSSTSAAPSSSSNPKVKISTLVQPSDYPSFSLAYGQLLKVTFVQTMRMKRKARTAGTGSKGKSTTVAESQKAQKKRTRVAGVPGDEKVLPKVYGPRRGAGHSARQARWNARVRAANKILASRRRKEANSKPMFPDLVKSATASAA
jgi:signal recognition particle subunit SRP14